MFETAMQWLTTHPRTAVLVLLACVAGVALVDGVAA